MMDLLQSGDTNEHGGHKQLNLPFKHRTEDSKRTSEYT